MDVKEVEEVLNNLRWLQSQMPTAIANWQATKPNCAYNFGIVREICTYPGKINSLVFDPLIVWLSNYILNREGRIAFSGPTGLDDFLRRGLRNITNYIVIADFFSKNTDFFAPTPKITAENLSAVSEVAKVQQQYKDFINILSSKLIGCNTKLEFLFLNLSKTIRSLPDDLRKMQDFLERQCISLKARSL